MAQTTIWKPQPDNPGKGPVFLTDASGPTTPPTITTADGRTFTGRYLNTNHGRHQFEFPPELINEQNLQVSYAGQTSTIESGATSYEGSSLGNWQAREKGSVGFGGGGYPTQFQPGTINQYGVVPAYQGGKFPKPTFATFKPIKKAPFKYTDPFEFAGAYADLARQQIGQNIGLSKDIALDQLDTELQGLQRFVPAASALKRSEISLDNLFNQQQRLAQVESTLPGARQSLADQTARAETYAGGRLTDDLQDRALELGIRSRAADRAAAGGFGARSSVARKASDLMSAEERFKIAQYGENLLTGSIGTRADLLLAPTQYSDAGAQVKVTPTLSGSQLQQSAFGELNQNTILSPEAAITSEVRQREFQTNIAQRTREFNAANRFAESQFNAGVANTFGLEKFGYEVGYAGVVAGAGQTGLNTQIEIQQQQDAQDVFEDNREATQESNTIGAITSGALGVASIISDWFTGDLFGGGDDTSSTSTYDPSIDPTVTAPNQTSVDEGFQTPVPEGFYDDTTSFARSAATTGGRQAATTGGPTAQPIGPSAPAPAGGLPSQFAPGTTFKPGGATPSTGRQGATFGRSEPTRAAGAPNVQVQKSSIPMEHQKQLDALKAMGVDISSYVPPGMESAALARANVGAQRVMAMSGIYNQPGPGRVRIGYDDSGNPLYASPRLSNSADINQGTKSAQLVESIMKPFNAMSAKDQKRFSFIKTMANDPKFLGQLQSFHANGDEEGFIRALKDYALGLKPNAKPRYEKRVSKFVGAVEEGLYG